jgi:hypothetical protein
LKVLNFFRFELVLYKWRANFIQNITSCSLTNRPCDKKFSIIVTVDKLYAAHDSVTSCSNANSSIYTIKKITNIFFNIYQHILWFDYFKINIQYQILRNALTIRNNFVYFVWLLFRIMWARQWTVSQINQNDGKIAWIRLRIASPSTVFSRSGPQSLFLFADLKRMLAGKKFSTNEEVIVETEAYFETISKS